MGIKREYTPALNGWTYFRGQELRARSNADLFPEQRARFWTDLEMAAQIRAKWLALSDAERLAYRRQAVAHNAERREQLQHEARQAAGRGLQQPAEATPWQMGDADLPVSKEVREAIHF